MNTNGNANVFNVNTNGNLNNNNVNNGGAVAIVAIILLYLLNIFVGLVPVYSTIRKTPAEILSRTDVD